MYREVNLLNKPLPSIVTKNTKYSNPHYKIKNVYYTWYYKLSKDTSYYRSSFIMLSNQKVLHNNMYTRTNVHTSILYPNYSKLCCLFLLTLT